MIRRIAGVALLLTSISACQGTTEPNKMMPGASPSFAVSGGSCTLANGNVVSTGFDQYGYNRCAHNFVGTFGGWCAEQGAALDCAGVPGNTRLNMKWNEEWDRGNATGWSAGPYSAWLDNEIKGAGFSEHFKTKWDQGCADSGIGTDGGPCIWGPFEIIMDQGTDGGVHVWWTKLSPAGFGS
jgi:hypothetical protein